jgi:hypothetical protein
VPSLFEAEVGFEPTTFRLQDGCSASTWSAPHGSSLLTLDAPSVQTALDGYRPIVWMIIGMIKAHPTEIRWQDKQTLICHHLLSLDQSTALTRCRPLPAPVLAWPAASKVVAEDAYQTFPFQHRVDQVTFQEWDGVDVGQPRVRLDVEVGLSG